MGRRIVIPGLVDLLLIDSAEEILAVSNDPALQRGATTPGPLLNRVILRRAQRVLRTPSQAYPSALPKDNAQRQEQQKALATRLHPDNAACDEQSLDALADYLKGKTRRPLGPLCQEAIGRLFEKDYQATRETWRAAELLDNAVRSINPLRQLVWTLTGAVKQSQATIAAAVNGDTAGAHATSIAVHTFKASVANLERAMSNRSVRRSYTTLAILGGALGGPENVLRHSSVHADTAAGPVAPGTLVLLQVGKAVKLSADQRVAFLSESWSFCPAHHIVPVMLAEIWHRATGERL